MPEATNSLTIAIDGGAASGKSSTSGRLAERLNLMHVDTGSHYRTLTHALLELGMKTEAQDGLVKLLRSLNFQTRIEGRSAHLCVNDKIPSREALRSEEVNLAVSVFAAIPEVRKSLFNYQRNQPKIATDHGFSGLIMEGRDIGSVILPDADFCFYLHADESTRAARRANQGQPDAIAQRDKLDKARKTAPLTCPEGAIRIDTGKRTLEEVLDYITAIIEDA